MGSILSPLKIFSQRKELKELKNGHRPCLAVTSRSAQELDTPSVTVVQFAVFSLQFAVCILQFAAVVASVVVVFVPIHPPVLTREERVSPRLSPRCSVTPRK